MEGIGTTMDVFAAVARLAGASLPPGRTVDGLDVSAALFGRGPSPRLDMLHFRGTRAFALRHGEYKAHFRTKPGFGLDFVETVEEPPLLFHLGRDPRERHDIAGEHPEIVAELAPLLAEQQAGLT